MLKKSIVMLICGILALGMCACDEPDKKADTSSVVKYTTADYPDYDGVEGDAIDVKLSGTVTGNGSTVKSVKVAKSGATVISISKKNSKSSDTKSTSGNTSSSVSPDVPEEITFDYVMDFDTDDITILQLSDFMVIDSAQQREIGNLNKQFTELYTKNNMKTLLFDYIDALVEKVKPDLIIVTGNLVHGQFDDLGTSFKAVVEHMESLKTFWAPVFGDYDGISAQGVLWQCKQLEDAEYCLFKNTEGITGNSNYSVGISVNGKVKRGIYLLDSNGCQNTSDGNVSTVQGMDSKQIDWLKSAVAKAKEKAGNIPSFVAFNRPPEDISNALVSAGYETNEGKDSTYEIGKDVTAQNGDFGTKGAALICGHKDGALSDAFKALNIDGVFTGRNAGSCLSVLYNGIRWTVGSKTGKYDTSYHINGGIRVDLNNGLKNFNVTNIQ